MEGTLVETRFLGPPEIMVDAAPVEVDTRKAIALLAYLTVERSPTRDTLANLFWGDSTQERARATLRRTLSSLRSAIGASSLKADRLRVTLGDEVASDITEFEDALAVTESHGHSPKDVCPDCTTPLLAAARLYRGDFLEGFSVRDAPDFEDWVRTTAEHYRIRAATLFQRLAGAQAAEGDYTGAIATVNRWLEHDPLHEPAYRQLMLLCAWSGDRPGAVEAYRSCVAVLDRQLEVAPLEETTELYGAILDEDLPPAPAMRRRVKVADAPTRSITPGDMIDRGEELELLSRELGQVSGGGRLVVIIGEAWMGKTRLVDEFLSLVDQANSTTIRTKGFRGEKSLPFGVVVQALRGVPANHGDHPLWVTREVSRLLPDMAPPGEEPPPPVEANGETRLFDAVITVLDHYGSKPSVLWVDDAQWSDPASVSFLTYLANRIGDTGYLLVISMRPADPDTSGPLRDMIRHPTPDLVIELGPLGPDDLVGTIDDPTDAEEAVARTGGIPLLLSEYLEGGGTGLGVGIHRFVEEHLSELSGLEGQVLTSVAVLGGSSDIDLVRTTSGRTDDEVVQAVERLVARDLLRISADGSEVSFALEAVEHLIYETTSVVRRRLLHRRAGSMLAKRHRVTSDARGVTAVARHLHMSGSELEAAEWYARAGDLSYAVYAHIEAESSYRLAQALGYVDPARIRLSLARLYLLTGRYREALTEFETVAATSTGETGARAEHGVGEVHRRLGRFDLALHHFHQAEADHPEPSLLYADWGMLALRSGDPDEAVRLAQHSLAEAETQEDKEVMARAHHLLGVVSADATTAQVQFEKALELATDSSQRMASLNGLARSISREGDYASALPVAEEALDLAKTIGDRHRQAALLNHLADIHHGLGDVAGAEALVTESVRLFAEIEPDAWEPEIWLLTGW